MDGTLIDSTRAVAAAYAEVVARAGLPSPSADEIIAAYPLGPPRVILTALTRRPATDTDLDAYHDGLRRRTADVVVYPGVIDTLAKIAAEMPQAVFTGASTDAATILLTATGLIRHFTTVIGGDQCVEAKPHPDGLVRACASLGVFPEKTAYVGDSPLDMRCARRAGAVSVAAGWGHQHDHTEPSDLTAVTASQVLTLLMSAPPEK